MDMWVWLIAAHVLLVAAIVKPLCLGITVRYLNRLYERGGILALDAGADALARAKGRNTAETASQAEP
ncbi:hypothetical protein REH65_18745 [Saccharopolyspora sp. ID03-671]|uniref:hypothetical protein n=1 Tax=Saccharopolyspora sp. ID03-671 TaxID=3073066 RepID=UPI00324CA123